MKPFYVLLSILLITLSISACKKEIEETYEIQQPENPENKEDRKFGITPSESEQGFVASFDEAQNAGVDLVELSLEWSYFESSPGEYSDEYDLLNAISYYGDRSISLALSMAVINTVSRTEPDYLKTKAFNDPNYITAFNDLMDWILQRIPSNVTIAYISVGNEVDIFLGGDSQQWNAYKDFANQVMQHLRTNHPGHVLGVKTTLLNGLLGPTKSNVEELLTVCDVAMINYYPQNENFEVSDLATVNSQLDQMINLVAKPIYMTELGYQSGSKHCNSSEAKQARFFHEYFKIWDKYKDQIKVTLIDWLHDASADQVDEWTDFYGLSSKNFAEYLSTLGLRNHDHTDKAAWKQVIIDSNARGWNR